MEKSGNNREWVKTAAIIFLLILLILTFFSNTIMNMTLAEVSTYAVTDGSISAKVRATGKVTAVGNNQVKAEGTRTIAAVKVKEGQEVSEGDILFVMGQAGSEELETAETARDSAYYNYERAKVSYPNNTASSTALWRAECELADAENQRNLAAAQLQSLDSDPEVLNAKNAMDNAKTAYDLQYEKDQTEYRNIDAQEVAIAQTEQSIALENLKETPDPAELKRLQDLLVTQNSELIVLQAQYSATEYETSVAYSEYQSAEAKYNAILSAKQTPLQSALTSAQTKYDSAYSALLSAQDSYNVSVQTYNQSVAQQNINTEEAKHNLDKTQAKVDNLNGVGEDINVYAKVSGTVSSVSFSSGDKVTKDDVMCTIEVPDMGYTMEATVTKDQASRLKVGDVGEQNNYYWNKSVTGTITSIKADPKAPQEKRIVTFELEGDVTSGQELTLSVGSRTATYDYIVPKSAVKSDNNGNFVLVIDSKNNALGNRYFARRVNVEILAEDDSYRAISGDIGYGDFIITTSSTKVNSGDQVRLADSN